MTEGNFPGKECTKQLLYLLTGDVKANFSRDTITLPNLIMAQCNVKANFRESRDTITLPNLVMAQYNYHYHEDGNIVPSPRCGFSFEAAFQL